jgi:hypothetical protein
MGPSLPDLLERNLTTLGVAVHATDGLRLYETTSPRFPETAGRTTILNVVRLSQAY